MRKTLIFLFCIIYMPLMAVDYPEKPVPPKLVNDFTNTLSPDEAGRLENKLAVFNDTTSIQIAVVMLKTLDGYPPSDYAFELAQRWGIGQKGTNNGVLLLISMDEHKLFIATGYGMEGIMPDALCRRIIENDITPYFKQGQYYEGIDNGTTQMMALAKGEYKGTGQQKSAPTPLFGIGILLFIFFIIFIMRIRSTRSYASMNSIPFWAAWSLLNSAGNRSGGSWTHFSGGSGGFGGGGGGGFGGFGGGSFGGGGAGGSW